MIIVCTQDVNVRNNNNGAGAWGATRMLNPGGQPGATAAFRAAAGALAVGEALCISAHGNNNEIGDAGAQGWVWSVDEVAQIVNNAPAGWNGPVLIHACANAVVNFSAQLAQAMRNRGFRHGAWIYGYNRAVGNNEGFPAPNALAQNVSLQGTQV